MGYAEMVIAENDRRVDEEFENSAGIERTIDDMALDHGSVEEAVRESASVIARAIIRNDDNELLVIREAVFAYLREGAEILYFKKKYRERI